MWTLIFLAFSICNFQNGLCNLFSKGVVHYTISNKDYDLHSQDIIESTLSKLQKEICVKFFQLNNATAGDETVVYINNVHKRKDCHPDTYDFSKNVVDMPIGYRCINEKDIVKIVVTLLRASIDNTVAPINSYDLIKQFRERDVATSGLLSPTDRNYINAHYHAECGVLSEPVSRRALEIEVVDKFTQYQKNLWPLGVVLYAVHEDIEPTDPNLKILNHAIATIELSSCVVFQKLTEVDILVPRNLLWFSFEGEDMPALGFKHGNQTLRLSSLSEGAPGHTAHALHYLLRVLGVPMMSNRFDRDNYVNINWNHVRRGKERYLEKVETSWMAEIPYDFNSASHAPANYMCSDCNSPLNYQTVVPVQDHLWQRTMTMGHRVDLSDVDKQILSMLYGKQCQDRYINKT